MKASLLSCYLTFKIVLLVIFEWFTCWFFDRCLFLCLFDLFVCRWFDLLAGFVLFASSAAEDKASEGAGAPPIASLSRLQTDRQCED